jgi:hypothetical protein
MVYQIYYGDKRPGETLFDIEYFLTVDESKKDTDEKWYVELHCRPIVSESVNFIRYILRPELVDDFIKDCAELEDLRGWIWEQHRNWLRTMDAAQKDYAEWGKYIREKVDTFCNKYGLYLNID